MAVEEILVRIGLDSRGVTSAVTGLRRETDQATRAIKTMFESVGQYADRTTRYAEGLGRRMQVVRDEAKKTEEAIRRLNIEQRGGGSSRSASSAIDSKFGSNVATGVRDYLGVGSVAAATTFALSATSDFIKDSVASYREASRITAALESGANRAGVSYGRLRGDVADLNRELAISKTSAESALFQAERLVTRAGRAGTGATLVEAATRSSIGAGLGPDRVPSILQGIASGEEEQFRALFGATPSTFYSQAVQPGGAFAGRSVTSLNEQEKLLIRINLLQKEGAGYASAYEKYLESSAGKADRLSAAWDDIKTSVGGIFTGSLSSVGSLALGGPLNPLPLALSGYRQAEDSAVRQFSVGGRADSGGGGGALVFVSAIKSAADYLAARIIKSADYLAARNQIAIAGRAIELDNQSAQSVGLDRVRLLRAGADPIEQLRVRYAAEQEAILRAAQDRANADPVHRFEILQGAYGQIDLSRRAHDIESERASSTIGSGLESQLAAFRSKAVGPQNPYAAMFIEAKEQARQFEELVKTLNPKFAEKAGELRGALAGAQAAQFTNAARANVGDVIGLQNFYYSLQERPAAATGQFRRGLYGQLTDEPIFGGPQFGETARERVTRAFGDADRFAAEFYGTGADREQFARTLRLSAGSGVAPADLTAEQRTQLQRDALAATKEANDQRKLMLDYARRTTLAAEKSAGVGQAVPEDRPPATPFQVNVIDGSQKTDAQLSSAGGALGAAITDVAGRLFGN